MPPATGVTPIILILNAIITAVAAVIAVALAQWWTTRRDRDEREEQRRRDSESWRREDRARFLEHRRETYAELIGELRQSCQRLSRARYEITRITREGTGDREHYAENLESLGLAGWEDQSKHLQVLAGRLELVAPQAVLESCNAVLNLRISLLTFAMTLSQLPLRKLDVAVDELVKIMREDVGPGSNENE